LIQSSQKIECYDLVQVPEATFQKYRRQKHLKRADALIAAFADFMKADYIVSENRHIYRDLKATGFVALTEHRHRIFGTQHWKQSQNSKHVTPDLP